MDCSKYVHGSKYAEKIFKQNFKFETLPSSLFSVAGADTSKHQMRTRRNSLTHHNMATRTINYSPYLGASLFMVIHTVVGWVIFI